MTRALEAILDTSPGDATDDAADTGETNGPGDGLGARSWRRALAPKLGGFTTAVHAGQLVRGGELLGHLSVLQRRYPVRMPAAAPTLRVVEVLAETRDAPVSYRGALLQLEPLTELDEGGAAGTAPEAVHADLGAEAVAVRSPVDGQFYRQPSPDDPPFAEVDDVVEDGHVVGLVEVMKFFYEVTFEAPARDTTYRVARFEADDASPVASGAPIVWLVPVS